jgi:predicted enzyme related to lactoylglutathione lyase
MALKAGMVTIDCADPHGLADDRESEVKRLVGLGATVLDEQEVPGLRWTVLADPEGNEFCVGD